MNTLKTYKDKINYTNKTAVVTGATSFIGVHLITELLKNNYKVICIVRPSSCNLFRLPEDSNIIIVELELSNYDNLINIINIKIDIFFHLAWEGIRGVSREDILLQRSNYKASIDAVKSAIGLGCTSFVGIGSQAEYGNIDTVALESMDVSASTAYGKEKRNTCIELKKICEQNKIHFIWARVFSVYGIYDYPNSLIMHCLERMLKNEEVQLSECTNIWNYTYVEDVVKSLILLSESKHASGIYNVASNDTRMLKEFVLEIASILNSNSVIKFNTTVNRENQMINLNPSIDRLINDLHWKPSILFSEGINKILINKGYI